MGRPRLAAWPSMNAIARQGRCRKRPAFHGDPNDGQFLSRKVPDEIRSRPAV